MKRLISLLLAVLLLCSPALGAQEYEKPQQPEETATEETAAVRVNNSYGAFYYSNLESALYTCAFESSGRTTITLLQDLDLTGLESAADTAYLSGHMDVAAPGALMLDLNGYTLTYSGDTDFLNQYFASAVTVKNGVIFYSPAGADRAAFRQGVVYIAIPEEPEETEEAESLTETAETVEETVDETAGETADETAGETAEEPAEEAVPEEPEIQAPTTRLTLQNLVIWNLGGGSILHTRNHKCIINITDCLLWSASGDTLQARRPTAADYTGEADPEKYFVFEGEFDPQIIIKNSVVGSTSGHALVGEAGAAAAVINSVLVSGAKTPVARGSFITSNVQGEETAWTQQLPDGSTLTAQALLYGEAPDASAIPDLTNLPYVPPAPKPAPRKPIMSRTTLLSLSASAVVVALIVITVPKKKEEQ